MESVGQSKLQRKRKLLLLSSLLVVTAVFLSFHGMSFAVPNLYGQQTSYECPIRQDVASVFYNRIPKAASRSVVHYAKFHLHQRHYLKEISSHVRRFDLETEEGRFLAERFLERFWNATSEDYVSEPYFLYGHVHFVNLSNFYDFFKIPQEERQFPTYVNVVREPVSRFISRYYYSVQELTIPNQTLDAFLDSKICENATYQNWVTYIVPELNRTHMVCEEMNNFQTKWLCGQSPECLIPGKHQLELAKRNIDTFYAYVGLTEELENTLRLLHVLFPSLYQPLENISETLELPHLNRNAYNPPPSLKHIQYLRSKNKLDSDLYEYVKRKHQLLVQRCL